MPGRRHARAPSGYVVTRSACAIIFHEPDDRGIGQHPQIADFVFIHTVCAEAIPGCRRASDLSCLWVQMEQTTLANKPDIPIVYPRSPELILPTKWPSLSLRIMSECSGRRIKLVQAAVFGAKPKIAATVLGDALDRSTTDTIGVVGVMKVAGTAFGFRVEFVHPSVGGNPQIAVIVFHQILKKLELKLPGSLGLFLYTTKALPS